MRVVEFWAWGIAKLEGGVVDVDAEETRVRSCRGEEVAREGCGDIVSQVRTWWAGPNRSAAPHRWEGVSGAK